MGEIKFVKTSNLIALPRYFSDSNGRVFWPICFLVAYLYGMLPDLHPSFKFLVSSLNLSVWNSGACSYQPNINLEGRRRSRKRFHHEASHVQQYTIGLWEAGRFCWEEKVQGQIVPLRRVHIEFRV